MIKHSRQWLQKTALIASNVKDITLQSDVHIPVLIEAQFTVPTP